MSTLEQTGLAPRILGHYQLVREAGRGGMSIVYEAIDTRLGRTVALKVLHSPSSTLAGEEEMVARMEREARAIASLSHPNVITIYDVGQEGTLHYLATEFLDGITLRERLNQGPLTPDQAADVLRQVADGLDAVHRQGVMHRDIKPSNIMLLYNGRVKLLDFGIARFANDSTLTQIGSMVGSPSYMAPELLHGEKAAPASDIWALGVLLFEMLSNRLPFEADSMGGVMYHVMYDDPMPLPNASPKITDVLHQALNKSLPERFPTARALADAFGDAIAVQPAFKDSKPEPAQESAMPPPAVQREMPVVRTEEKTLLAPAPVVTQVREQSPAPVRRSAALPRRNRLLPAVLAFAALWTVAVVGYTWRRPSSQSAQRTLPTIAANRPTAGKKGVPAPHSASALVPKFTHPNAEVHANLPFLSGEKTTSTGIASVRKPAPMVPAPPIASAKRVGGSSNRRTNATPVRVARREANSTSSARSHIHETDHPQRAQVRELQNLSGTEQAGERRSEPQTRVRNAELGAEENSGAQTDLRGRLHGWIAATNARDIGEQMRYYSPSLSAFYLKRDVPTDAVRAEKARLFARASDVDIRTDTPQIKLSSDGKLATMRFRKQYNINNGARSKRGTVLQELRWKRDGEDWKIVSERDLRVLKN